MKRFAMLMLMAAFVLGTVGSASAIHLFEQGGTGGAGVSGPAFTAKGSWVASAQWTDNMDFTAEDGEDDFEFWQRARTYFTFAANENVKGVLKLEIGSIRWGQNIAGTAGNDFALGGDGVNIEVKNAYLEYKCPFTGATIKGGLQGITLPSVVGNPICDDDMAALVASYPVNDQISVLAGFARPYDLDDVDAAENADDEQDVAFVAVPLALDGMTIIPYFAYSWIGDALTYRGVGLTDDATAWWLGANVSVKLLDPIGIYADLIYGSADTGDMDVDHDGWYLALAADMKLDMMTPFVWFTYATGSDEDTDSMDYMPFFSGDWFPTTFGADGSALDAQDSILSAEGRGLMTIGVALKDLSFVPGLTHTVRAMYAKGTSDADSALLLDDAQLTEDDSVIELNFDSKYMLYDSLAAIVELGYINPDIDDDNPAYGEDADEAAWRLAVGLKYDF